MKFIKQKWEKAAALQIEMDAAKLRAQAAGLAMRDLQQEITDLEHSDMILLKRYSTASSNSEKIQIAKERLADAKAEHKAGESLQNDLGHSIAQATAEAWRLHAELEIKDVLPKLLTAYALWQSSGGGSFEAGMLTPYFEQHRADIPKIADRLKVEMLR